MRSIVSIPTIKIELEKGKIYLHCGGRLGNQLMQYALAYCLLKENKGFNGIIIEQQYVDFKDNPKALSLKLFNLPFVEYQNFIKPYASGTNQNKSWNKYDKLRSFRNMVYSISPLFLRIAKGIYIGIKTSKMYKNGNLSLIFQKVKVNKISTSSLFIDRTMVTYSDLEKNIKELREAICSRSEITTSIALYNDIISNSNSVCISVRGGDYLSQAFKGTHNICTPDYYNKAIRYIKDRIPGAKFYVCTDDIFYAKAIFSEYPDFYYEEPGSIIQDIISIYTKCKHFIIPNSTFALWLAYLGQKEDSVVISPGKNNIYDDGGWYPKEWITLA